MPWRSSSYDLALSLPRVWARSLVRELRSHKLCCAAGVRTVHYPHVVEGDILKWVENPPKATQLMSGTARTEPRTHPRLEGLDEPKPGFLVLLCPHPSLAQGALGKC